MELPDLIKEQVFMLHTFAEFTLQSNKFNENYEYHFTFANKIKELIQRIRVANANKKRILDKKLQISLRKEKIYKFTNCVSKHMSMTVQSFVPIQLSLEEIIKCSHNLSLSNPPISLQNTYLPRFLYFQPMGEIPETSLIYPLNFKKRMPKPKIIPCNEGLLYTYVKHNQKILIDTKGWPLEFLTKAFIRCTFDEIIPTSTNGTKYEMSDYNQNPISVQKDMVFTCVLCCLGLLDSEATQMNYKVTSDGQNLEENNVKNANTMIRNYCPLGELDIISDMTPGMTPIRMTPTTLTPSHKTPVYNSSIYTPVYGNRKNSSSSILESP